MVRVRRRKAYVCDSSLGFLLESKPRRQVFIDPVTHVHPVFQVHAGGSSGTGGICGVGVGGTVGEHLEECFGEGYLGRGWWDDV